MLSLIIETNENNQIAAHWVLETNTFDEVRQRIKDTPLRNGNKRVVYTSIDVSEIASKLQPNQTLFNRME